MNLDLTYQLMLPILEMCHKVTGSYGWSIVVLTILVRLVVWPLQSKSTRSMQRMSQLQPQLKAMQEKYKATPEVFQQKTMEFYKKNNMNPMGGCLPMLIQFPILIALYSTFSGPPFCDKVIDLKIDVVPPAQAAKAEHKETSGNSSPYVGTDGKMAKIVVFPGEGTYVQGETVDFFTREAAGVVPKGFEVKWRIFPKNTRDPNALVAHPGQGFTCTFGQTGEYHVNAIVPGVAKEESFLFIHELGKSASQLKLLNPANFDLVILILLFGLTMYLSQKFTVPQSNIPESEMDEQQKMQRDTMKTMPIAMTGMFFFVPLPTGVYLYMVIANVVQTLQTWLIMKSPAPPLVDVMDDGEVTMSQATGDNARVVDNNGGSPKLLPDNSSNGDGATIKIPKRAAKKKKKK